MESALFTHVPSKPPGQLSPLVLAYIGDCVYELYVRQYVVAQANHRPDKLHKQSVQLVNARTQAENLELWLPLLTDEELNMVKRGRNAKSGSTPKNTSLADYRHSTAFECLVGYLYYMGRFDRLKELLGMITPKGK